MKYKKIIIIIVVLLVSAVAFWGVLQLEQRSVIQDTVVTDFVEISDYQGEDFSSLDDFHENSIKGPQYIDINQYNLVISGLIDKPQSLSYDQVLEYPSYKKDATLHCVEGWSVRILWEGVLLSELLNSAGVKSEANTIIFKAYDGYSTSFPLDYVLDNKIIMAYKMNDAVIPPERGYPFQLVAESKWGYKWIKWITEIELSDDPDYRGYWESRGYSNSGDLDKPRYEN